MTSPLRRKLPITASRRTAIRFECSLNLLLVLAVCLFLNAAPNPAHSAPQSDSQTGGYAPPVHIPPRVPLFDPGLPETLNGRFNSTHQIRSDVNSGGQRINISDGDQQSWSSAGHEISERRGAVRHTVDQSRSQRRPGLQDKFSELMANGSRPRADTPTPIRGQAIPSQHGGSQQPSQDRLQQNRMQQSIVSAVDSFSPNQRFANQGSVDSSQYGPAAARQRPTGTGYLNPNLRMADGQDVRQRGHARNSGGSQFTRGSTRQIPARDMARQAGRPATIQTAGLQQFEDQETAMVETIQSTADGLAAPADKSQAFDEREFLTQNFDPQARTNRQLQSIAENRSARTANTQQSRAKPVSVLNARDGELTLDAPGEVIDGYEMESGNSFEEAEFSINESMQPGRGNLLRQPRRRKQGEDPLRLSPRNGQQDELNSEFGEVDQAESDDEDDDDSQNPLKKSCDQFRSELLNLPITDIALDMSPPGKTDIFGKNTYRVWRDQRGNELAQGTISDLRRGYLLINSNGGVVRVPYARLSEADLLAVSEYWRLPVECDLGEGIFSGRCWTPQTATWHATSLCHKPLYFENIQLERYGHSHGPFLQPVASTTHFFTRLFFLPYNTAIHPPNECQYALGFYRPGNCAPWLRDPVPISLSGASRQSLIYTGTGFLTQ